MSKKTVLVEKEKREPKAYGYTRVSTVGQQEIGVSLETQKQKITEYCNYKKYNLVKVHEDALSGKDLKREGLKELRDVLEKGDYVIIADLSRLSRSTKDALILLEEFVDEGVVLICLNPDIDFSSPSGEMMFTVLMAMHRLERRNIGANVKANMQRISKEGKLRTKAPFGYKFISKDKDFEPVESQQQLVKKIIEMYYGCHNMTKVARELNEQGENVKLLDNKPNTKKRDKVPLFYQTTIKRILEDYGVLENEERTEMEKRLISYHKKEVGSDDEKDEKEE